MLKESDITELISEYGMESWPTGSVLEFGYNKGVVDSTGKANIPTNMTKKENFYVEQNGERYWISRSMAAATFVYKKINGKWYVLANKRGPGLPTNVGKWNCPSGYLDYDETIEECACREVFEETGIKVYPEDLRFMNIDSDPQRAKNQNVVVRYAVLLRDSEDFNSLTSKNAEPNEVDEIRWIALDDVDNYEWTSARHLWCIKNYINMIQYKK